MNQEQFNSLQVGDLVKHRSEIRSYQVIGNYGGHVTAIRTADITNPSEWDLVSKVVIRNEDCDPCKHCGRGTAGED